MRKPYKVINEGDSSEVTIYGNNHWRELEYSVPEWGVEEEASFRFKGNTYFLSEFLNIHNEVYNPNPPDWMKEFNGHLSDSYFSGVLVKLSDCGEAVKVYWYIS